MPKFLALVTSFVLVAAPPAPVFAAPEIVAAKGVGGVTLGALFVTLRAKGLLGPIGPGCELAGPNARSASLRPPLQGSVDLTSTEPRRVKTITIRGGAATRGVQVGSPVLTLRRAFPSARFDHSSDAVFGATFVSVNRYGGGPIGFAVSTTTKRVQLIALPAITTCD